MSNEETLIEFPCTFPIKVMGHSGPDIREAIERAIAEKAETGLPVDIQTRPSRTGKYMAYTVTCTYQSKAELDAMYQAFTSIDGVRMVL
ncbi:MAG: YbeD family protein [Gammaproteobacteria bacterium]